MSNQWTPYIYILSLSIYIYTQLDGVFVWHHDQPSHSHGFMFHDIPTHLQIQFCHIPKVSWEVPPHGILMGLTGPFSWKNVDLVFESLQIQNIHDWVLVSNIFYFHPYLGKMNPIWQAYFSRGWNQQLDDSFHQIWNLKNWYLQLQDRYTTVDSVELLLASWLIGSLSPLFAGFLYIPGGCLGSLNHQQ